MADEWKWSDKQTENLKKRLKKVQGENLKLRRALGRFFTVCNRVSYFTLSEFLDQMVKTYGEAQADIKGIMTVTPQVDKEPKMFTAGYHASQDRYAIDD